MSGSPAGAVAAATKSADDTRQMAAELAALARPSDVILVSGDLGSGKTTFAQGFGRGLGVHEPIVSPTFTLWTSPSSSTREASPSSSGATWWPRPCRPTSWTCDWSSATPTTSGASCCGPSGRRGRPGSLRCERR
jgi:hypothetical protein